MADETTVAAPAPQKNIKKAPRQGKARLNSPVSDMSLKSDGSPMGAGATIHRQLLSHPKIGTSVWTEKHFQPKEEDDHDLHKKFGLRAKEGKLSVEDLYRSYKNTPHAPASLLLKYAIHRINNHADYEDHAKGDASDEQFIRLHRVDSRNGHVTVDHLRDWLAKNNHIPTKLMKHKKALHKLIERGVGLNLKKINGETYVALRRGIRSQIMNKEHSLSSWTDREGRAKSYGTVHHAWVPLKDLWYSYDLGPKYPSGSYGPEDEFLVSNRGTKYEAKHEDVTEHNFRSRHVFGKTAGGVSPKNLPTYLFDNTTDDELAQAAYKFKDQEDKLEEIVKHSKAGPKTRDMVFNTILGRVPYHLAPYADPDTLVAGLKNAKEFSYYREMAENKNLKPEHLDAVVNHVLTNPDYDNANKGYALSLFQKPDHKHSVEGFTRILNFATQKGSQEDQSERDGVLGLLGRNQHLPDSIRSRILSHVEENPGKLRVLEHIANNPSHTEEDARRMWNLVQSEHKKLDSIPEGYQRNSRDRKLTETAWYLLSTAKLPDSMIDSLLNQIDSKDPEEVATARDYVSHMVVNDKNPRILDKLITKKIDDPHILGKVASSKLLTPEKAKTLIDTNIDNLTGDNRVWLSDAISPSVHDPKYNFVPVVVHALKLAKDRKIFYGFNGLLANARYDEKHPEDWLGLIDVLPHNMKENIGKVKTAWNLDPYDAVDEFVNAHVDPDEDDRAVEFYRNVLTAYLGANDRVGFKPTPESGHVLRPLPPDHVLNKSETFKTELGEWLAKMAVSPKNMGAINRQTDDAGEHTVNHQTLMNAHPAQNEIPTVKKYRDGILKSPKIVKPRGGKEVGVTAKVIYDHDGEKFMVKPFHEKITRPFTPHMKHLHLGWAEMAMQHLYHAAGMGEMCSNVHVANHPVASVLGGKKEKPMLVVHLHPHAVRGSSFYDDHDESMAADSRKMALMDFLTNNMDRHSQNVMVVPKSLAKPGHSRMLAIDHGRCFQYLNNYDTKWKNVPPRVELQDNIANYMKASGISMFDGIQPGLYGYDRKMAILNAYKPTFEWWGQNSEKIKTAFKEMLTHIKDPNVRNHLHSNFMHRARHLDDMAQHGVENFGTDWHYTPVPIVRPHQHTPESHMEPKVYELEDPALSQQQAANAEVAPKDDEAVLEALRAQKARKKAKQPRKYKNHDQLKLPGMSKL